MRSQPLHTKFVQRQPPPSSPGREGLQRLMANFQLDIAPSPSRILLVSGCPRLTLVMILQFAKPAPIISVLTLRLPCEAHHSLRRAVLRRHHPTRSCRIVPPLSAAWATLERCSPSWTSLTTPRSTSQHPSLTSTYHSRTDRHR